jgi:prepilin-type N-terminal cleavage/methylation domain-containing protein
MLSRPRHGFTLAEVLIALTLTLVLAAALYSLLVGTQRITRTQAQRVDLQSNVRAGALVVLSELRELSAVTGGNSEQNDVLFAGPSTLLYRAMRGIGFVCGNGSATSLRLARGSFTGRRDPQAGRDHALVFLDHGGPDGKDSWLATNIVGVATSTPCSGGVGPGLTLSIPANAALAGLAPGTPVRIAELMELRPYVSGGKSWLGARSVSTGEAIQPLIGPLVDGTGFRIEYLDVSGMPTANYTAIRSIRVALRGTTDAGGAGNSTPVEEELIAQVALRNAVGP